VREKGNKPVIGISIGEISGIGPEIILKTFANRKMLDFCIPVVYAAPGVINFFRKQLNIEDLKFSTINSASEPRPKTLNVVECLEQTISINQGKPDEKSGELARKSLESVVKDLNEGHLDACVTAPISKENIQKAGFDFPGQTEFFAEKSGSRDSLMFLCSDQMRIGLVSGHVPVAKLADAISKEKIATKLKVMISSLKKDFGITKPRVAVLGLNPHAGENGKIGQEEIDVIEPVIKEFKDKGELVFGPYPSDGLFGSGNFKKFDGILAMYHDQALIPFKMLSFENGVNYTAGLNIIRTSPDHGTAFDIAGKGVASESSFRSALFMAIDIWKMRNETSVSL
jgi:4-hydroxythreonine-4-phosphate dehydrogenase